MARRTTSDKALGMETQEGKSADHGEKSGDKEGEKSPKYIVSTKINAPASHLIAL